ncbi:NAD-dependent epimerase/dehydratase family protein [Bacillus sp. T33-2]|uniref:NAD-dependent epimerase/dehydratase family protein n=1 Tax=Bacillus sp. T33-2 TaxID=2054168 RepID=UPI000C776EFE|nr:NAD-dependent epimerase/dehydratase family protein [Bacillus sp. T33-2]PLR98422.1 hypothetical protein CVD19_04885 [Bacillus sp. T33-2]
MKVLVIGGTRFIGRFVVDQLLERGHNVALFHRRNHKTGQPVQNIYGDRKNLYNYKDKFMNLNPDVILDMIPMTIDDAKELL